MAIARRLSRHPDAAALVLLAALVLILLAPAATLQGVYFYGDSNDYFARLAYSAERWRGGQVPLWNPYLSLGGSHAADPAALAWYVPGVLLMLLLPLAAAYNYIVILHVLLAAVTMYALARAWAQSRAAALVAAIIYGSNGFVTAHLQHLNILVALAWLPLILFCLEKYWQSRRLFYLVLGSLALGLQILGGHTQIVLYGALAWGSYVVVAVIGEYRASGKKSLLGNLLAPLLVALGGLGLAAIFLIPFAELTAFTARAEHVTYEYATTFSLEPARLVTFVLPYFFGGNPGTVERGPGSLIEMSGYVGIFAFVLAALALRRPERRIWFLAALALLALLLALGKYTPLYALIYRLPLLGSVRAPARLLSLVVLGLALLAGFGFDRIKYAKPGWLTNAIFGVLIILPVLMLGLAIGSRVGTRLPVSLAQAGANPALFAAVLFTLASAAVFGVWVRGLFSERVRVAVTLALVFVDFLFVAWNFRYNRVAPPAIYFDPPGTAAGLTGDRDGDTTGQSIYYWARNETKQATYLQRGELAEYIDISRAGLRQSLPMRFHIRSLQGYGSEPPAYTEIVGAIDDSQQLDAPTLRLLGTFGGKRVLSQSRDLAPAPDGGVTAPGASSLTPLLRSGGVTVYSNEIAAPRASFVGTARAVPDHATAILWVGNRLTTSDDVVVEAPAAQFSQPLTLPVRFLHDAPERIALYVETPTDGYLVLRDTYYPGWQAAVDGQPAPIYRANALVRAVPVSSGAHTVEFVYDPLSVKIGALVSSVTLAALAGGLLVGLVRRRRSAAATGFPNP